MNRYLTLVLLVLGLFPWQASVYGKIRVDDRLPAGNVVVERMSGDTVFVKPDLRGNEREWFYWAMRVRGAQGKTLVFQFPRRCVGARGAVVSLDRGKSFFFAGGKTGESFTWTFGPADREVYFYECHPYLPKDWRQFIRSLDPSLLRQKVFCRSRSGKKVPCAVFGRLDGGERHHVVITARHHCSESMASYVMEGIAQGCCAQDETGHWLREQVELTFVPFVDYDGVVNGEQGKYRSPHDHNRDYLEFLFPETRAVSALYLEKHPDIILDLHCPWISGEGNELVYSPLGNPANDPDPASEVRFTQMLERYADGLPYKAENNLPFGVSWNTGSNYAGGMSCLRWARANAPGAHVCRSLEIPFANAQGTEVNPESCRAFGRGIAKAIAAWFQD